MGQGTLIKSKETIQSIVASEHSKTQCFHLELIQTTKNNFMPQQLCGHPKFQFATKTE